MESATIIAWTICGSCARTAPPRWTRTAAGTCPGSATARGVVRHFHLGTSGRDIARSPALTTPAIPLTPATAQSHLRSRPPGFHVPSGARSSARPYEQLLKEIEETSYLAVGRKYGVSDNAIRKWIRF